MVGRLAGAVAAASVLTAQALLIPPGVQRIDDTVELTILNTNWQTVTLPCPDCVLPNPKSEVKDEAEDDTPFFIQGGANSLLVNVTTLYGGNAVGLEDYTLYPPLRGFNKPTVDMIPSEASFVEVKDTSDRRHTVTVSGDTTIVHEETVAPEGDAVIRIKYHIMSVDNHPVTVDSIEITCLKGADNKLAILNVEPVPSADTIFDSTPASAPHGGKGGDHPAAKKPCNLPAAVCEWRDFLESKVSELSAGMPKKLGGRPGGCHGRKGQGKGKHLPSHRRPNLAQFHKGGPDHGEGHHGRPHHRHSPFHGLIQGFFMVLIPIFLGITMGMAVSLVGMLVGRFIGFVWTRFVRGGRRGYASVSLSEEDAETADAEKAEVESVNAEPLPRYEEAPAYEEKESK